MTMIIHRTATAKFRMGLSWQSVRSGLPYEVAFVASLVQGLRCHQTPKSLILNCICSYQRLASHLLVYLRW